MRTLKINIILGTLFALLFFPCKLNATFSENNEKQQNEMRITGKVVDSRNDPLIGVNIIVKGTLSGTTTDANGNFTLTVPNEQSILVFTYIGYISQEAKAARVINIIMKEDTETLDELIVIGYGVQRKSDLTGSVGHIGSDKIIERQVINPIDALSGKIAGVQVNNNSGRPGGSMSIVIRGFNSINASNSPLFVIDGVIGADINLLNPNEIESFNVLKDASSTAIYGARGAAGVILVTTKKGDFDLEPQVTYSLNLGISKLARKIAVMNSDEFMHLLNKGFENDGFEAIDWQRANPLLFNSNGKPIYNTDWQDETYQTAFSNRHYLTLNAGSRNSKTTVSFGYQDEQGVMINTWFKRFNTKISNETKINNRIQLTTTLSYNHAKESRLDDYGIGAMNIPRTSIEIFPVVPVRFEAGNYGRFDSFKYPSTLISGGQPVLNSKGEKMVDYNNLAVFWSAENPVQIANDIDRKFTTGQLLGNTELKINIVEGLTFRTSAAVEVRQSKDALYTGSELYEFSNGGANASQSATTRLYWQSENFLTYDKKIDEQRINIMAGASWSGQNTESLSGSGKRFTSDFFKYYNIGLAEQPGVPSSSWSEWKMNSYYIRGNYVFKNKYLATVTGRYDGSSVFGADNRYAFFPSGALAWVVKEEGFLKDVNLISNLKLRASVGRTGNAGISAYSTLATLGSVNVVFGDKSLQRGAIQSRMPNANLKWETTTQYDAGLDMGFIDNRISIGLDYYIKNTDDLLLSKPVSYVNGYGTVMDNVGKVQNKGFELTLNTVNVNDKNFRWLSTIIFMTNKNKVVQLSGDESDIWSAGFIGINYSLIRKGEALNTAYGLKRDGTGTWGTHEAAAAARYGKKPGDKKYVDRNNDGKIDYPNDGFILGNFYPKFEMSFSNTLVYKGFDLTLDIHGKGGNKAINLGRITYEQRTWYQNGSTALLNYWTPENQNTKIERPRTCMPFGGSPQDLQIDDDLIEDASYIRFKNLVFGYTLPGKISKNLYLKQVRAYINLENFAILTKYTGYDPEVSNRGGFSQGVEFFGHPKPININFGLNVNF